MHSTEHEISMYSAKFSVIFSMQPATPSRMFVDRVGVRDAVRGGIRSMFVPTLEQTLAYTRSLNPCRSGSRCSKRRYRFGHHVRDNH